MSTPRLHKNIRDDITLIPSDDILEMSVDENGKILELEYHTTADHLPSEVRRAVEQQLPGGTIVSCEKEYIGRKIYWEVEKEIDGLKREIMFKPDGQVRSTEFQIRNEDAPRVVLAAADTVVPGGELTSVEEVRVDATFTYHVKKRKDGIRYKVMLRPDGSLVRAVRETPAEVEVPIR